MLLNINNILIITFFAYIMFSILVSALQENTF